MISLLLTKIYKLYLLNLDYHRLIILKQKALEINFIKPHLALVIALFLYINQDLIFLISHEVHHMKLDRLNLYQSNYFHQKTLIANHQTFLGHKNQAQ